MSLPAAARTLHPKFYRSGDPPARGGSTAMAHTDEPVAAGVSGSSGRSIAELSAAIVGASLAILSLTPFHWSQVGNGKNCTDI